ncbi:MAG: hypothetical protein LBU24_01275 [Methanocalculaceae archaeon]|nr:hypothetical protein [Methanocalculaceae archaeon]
MPQVTPHCTGHRTLLPGILYLTGIEDDIRGACKRMGIEFAGEQDK